MSLTLSSLGSGLAILNQIALERPNLLTREFQSKRAGDEFQTILQSLVEGAFPKDRMNPGRALLNVYCKSMAKANASSEEARVEALIDLFRAALDQASLKTTKMSDGTEKWQKLEFYYSVNCAAPEGKKVFFGSIKTVGFFDIETGKRQLFPTTGDVNKMMIHKGMVFHNGDEGICRMRSAEDGRLIRSFEGHSGTLSCMKVLGDRLITGGKDATCRFWNINTGECERIIQCEGPIDDFDAVGDVIVVLSRSDRCSIITTWNSSEVPLYRLAPNRWFRTVKINQGAIFLAGVGKSPICEKFDLKSGEPIGLLDYQAPHPSSDSIHFVKERAVVVATKQCIIWDHVTNKTLILDAGEEIESVAIRGEHAVLGFYGTCSLWNLLTQRRVAILLDDGKKGIVQCVVSDGKLVCWMGTKILIRPF